MSCPHSKINTSLDRWAEAHWNLHRIEENYHKPEPFRYSLNAFLRVIQEVYEILKKDLQNEADFHSFIKPLVELLREDPLLSAMTKKRHFIVHHGMLSVKSKATAGSTRGGGRLKIGVGFDIPTWESSDAALIRFAQQCKSNKNFYGLMGLDDDDLYPCIQRVWLLPEFGDRDLLELAIEAWRKVGQIISKLVIHFGGEPLDLSLSCGHSPERVRLKVYSKQQWYSAMNAKVI